MTATAEWKAASRHPTFSFYLTAPACKQNPAVALAAAELADGITISGPKGPDVAKRLRDAGLEVPFLFDGEGYKPENLLGPEMWVEQQAQVGAARLLLPGVFIPWDKDSAAAFAPLAESSAKVRRGDPIDEPEDIDGPWWAGVVPVTTRFESPRTSGDFTGDANPPSPIAALSGLTPEERLQSDGG